MRDKNFMNHMGYHFIYIFLSNKYYFLDGDFFVIFFTGKEAGTDDFLTEGEDIGVVFFFGVKKSGIGSDFILL